jgi:glycerophosphoryl diester phosphodiesterase
MVHSALVSSFDHRAVKRVGELEPRVRRGVLYAARPADGGVSLAHAASAQVVLPQEGYVRTEDVAEAHAAGLQVVPWTTSDPERVRELIAMGVDGLCTNCPDVLAPEVVR